MVTFVFVFVYFWLFGCSLWLFWIVVLVNRRIGLVGGVTLFASLL